MAVNNMSVVHGFVENPVTSVKLSVEALPESKIQEISLDGTETFYRPLTMSENLCKMATKIDFLAEEEGRVDEDDGTDEEMKKSFQNQRWPWESIRNHLQQALTEMNVLTDVLTITHNKGPPKKEIATGEGGKYMMFDQARKELPVPRLYMQLPAKKKGLNMAADIISGGEKRLKSANDDTMLLFNSYHFQLLKLRKYWRIRKVGSKILGDLSYRTAGSDFWHNGNFEVIKTTSEENELETNNSTFSPLKPRQQSSLKVVVGADLTGFANIVFSIRRKGELADSISFDLCQVDGLVIPSDPDWHVTLTFAQSMLFCRELFNKLAKEAVQLRTSATLTPFLVVGNKISTNIFLDTELSIELVTRSSSENFSQKFPKHRTRTSRPSDNIFSLQLASMKLLLEHYRKLFNIPAPHPSTATFGLSKVQRKAPTQPYMLTHMQNITEKQSMSMIERLILMAKHWELRRRVCEVIDMIGSSIQDPYLMAHWSTINNTMEASVCIVILSAGYEASNRTLVNMTIGTDSVKAVQKDGRKIQLSSDLHHIRDYLLSLLCSHQLITAQEVCNVLGWTIQHFTLHSGIGPKTALGSVGTIMAVSPISNSSVSVRCWIERGGHPSRTFECLRYEVHTQTIQNHNVRSKMQRASPNNWMVSELNALQDPKWSLIGGEWKQIDLNKLYGKSFISKFESLLMFSANK